MDLLRAAFGESVEITVAANGDPTVKMTENLSGPVTLPDDVGAFTLDLAGQTLSGTDGVNGTTMTPGTDGGPAIVVLGAGETPPGGVVIAVTNTSGTAGGIVGGNGGDGNPPGNGAAAISGTTTVTDPQGLVTPGENGQPLEKAPEQKALEEAFKPNAYVEPMTNAEGQVTNYNVTVTNDITGPVIVPENVAAFIVDLDGHSITGTVGEVGGEATAGGEGTSAIVVSNAAAQVSVVGPGSITGGNGGAGNPPGEGAEAIVTSEGEKVEASVSGDAEVAKGEAGADLKSDEQKDLEDAFKPNAVVTPLTDDDGNVTNYNVTVTNDITGPVIVPENVAAFIVDLDGHSITGTVGEVGGEATAGGEGAAAIVVSNAAAQVSVKGPGSITGGNGGAGNPPGEGAEAIVTSAGEKVDPAVSGDAEVAKGEDGADLKTDEQKDLEEAFEPNAYVEPMKDDDGNVTNYNVVVTNDITGPVVLPENVTDLILDLNGHSITGACGAAGGETAPGGDGAAAIVASNATVKVSVKGPGSITGGDGGAGNPPGEGGAAIADADGGTIAPASVTGGAKVAPGKSGYVAAAVEIVRVVTSHPWGGILNVEYVCARLRRGYAYKVSFFVTVDGEDKCWTVTLPTQDVSLESFRNTAVLRLDEKFGAGKRDPRAKIFATIDPIAVAE